MFKLSDFDYILPKKLISQEPIKPRDKARLLILQKESGIIRHDNFFNLANILKEGDVLVFNDSKVIPARIYGKKKTGGEIEIFLLSCVSNISQQCVWECLLRGKIKSGEEIFITPKVSAEIIKGDDKVKAVRFNCEKEKLFSLGETPLPPYIKTKAKLQDYQTVYAKNSGSVAAPTAGLHFTKRLFSKLKKAGIKTEFVTLHVGLGTFEPVKTENILQHKMHSELASIDKSVAKRLNLAKKEGRRIIAVGTTAARTLESFSQGNEIVSGKKWVDIFIYPEYKFNFVEGLITNFHLPKSTLLMLISALASSDSKKGIKIIKKAYAEAIELKYKFYSFGDGMFLC